ncbi:PREDICTED: uncharacterized protein LOC109344685 [Lupinus angustifolius]|uniref:uncharacterized protein LOC109344684 n=1 Tax=Lupinus angustifolius TaxID=3871 RepID=UPI00092FCAF8|nr:PREDICTED: uncharacterized protein LOC109344684 [Lupinus angustifolius]XP_019438982.1 PREDICTED: uncharacterized protein LOC109344685 [Lupinus angustifolius]
MENGNGFAMTLPIINTKNYDRWRTQMITIFGFQEVLEIVQNGYQEVGENENEAQRTTNFERIAGAKTTKEAWDSLEKSYEGAAKMKKVKLQTMRRKYELLQMKDNKAIIYYFTKILTLINQMKSCGEEVKGQSVIEKILRTLTPKLKKRGLEKNDDHALQAQSFKKPSGHWNKNKKKEKWKNFEQAKCKSKKLLSSKDEEARLAQNEGSYDDDQYLLMATMKNNDESGKKDWFTILDESAKNKIKFADHSVVVVEGIGKVMIQRKDGNKAYISNVLYVPKMKINLLSLGQLLEKGYTVEMKDGMLKVFDKNKHKILKAPLPANRTFKISIQISDQKYLQSTIMKDNWNLKSSNKGQETLLQFEETDESGIGETISSNPVVVPSTMGNPPLTQRLRQPHLRLSDYEVFSDSIINAYGDFVLMTLLVEMEPIDVEDALKQPRWIEAMEEELKSIEKNNT